MGMWSNALHSFIIVGSESAGRLAGISAAEGAALCLSCHTDSPARAAALKLPHEEWEKERQEMEEDAHPTDRWGLTPHIFPSQFHPTDAHVVTFGYHSLSSFIQKQDKSSACQPLSAPHSCLSRDNSA